MANKNAVKWTQLNYRLQRNNARAYEAYELTVNKVENKIMYYEKTWVSESGSLAYAKKRARIRQFQLPGHATFRTQSAKTTGWRRVLQNLIIAQLVKKSVAFNGTRRSIRCWPQPATGSSPDALSTQSKSLHPTSLPSLWKPPFHLRPVLPSSLFLPVYRLKFHTLHSSSNCNAARRLPFAHPSNILWKGDPKYHKALHYTIFCYVILFSSTIFSALCFQMR
jgi:hypothetical protein